MKKTISFALFLLLISLPLGFAKEEAAPPVSSPSSSPGLSLGYLSLGDKAEEAAFPFEFSVSPGKWSQARRGEIFTIGFHPEGFALPMLKEDPVPIRYPRWAVREGWEGTFVIAIEILTTGEVGRWKVIESTGYGLLDETATETVRQWRFHPGREQGKPAVMCIQVPVHFELREP